MYLIGIDDSGRGPLIGPMILAGVMIKKEDEKELKKLGAKDSKLLFHNQRIKIGEQIKKQAIKYEIIKIPPKEIDEAVFSKTNLNTLEAKKMAEIINKLNDKNKAIKVIIDCPSVNITAWKKKLISFVKYPQNLTIICEHKADFNHPVVSAASILAKVVREEEVSKLKKEYGNIGSGYPADPITQQFLKDKGQELRDSGIFRKSWQTWRHMFPDKKQKTLSDY